MTRALGPHPEDDSVHDPGAWIGARSSSVLDTGWFPEAGQQPAEVAWRSNDAVGIGDLLPLGLEFAVRGLGTPAPIAPTRFLVTDGPQPVRPQPPCTLACSLSYLARQQHCTPCDSWAAPHSAAFRYNCLSSTTNNPRSAASSAIRTSHIAAPSRGGFRGSNSASRVGTATEFIDSRPAAEAS
jgi:hypothetical protein